VERLPRTLRTLGLAMHTLLRFVIAKYNATRVPAEGEKGGRCIRKHEIAFRQASIEEDPAQLMQILVSRRSIRELISSNIPNSSTRSPRR
jgi:hypothetical protein